MDGGSIASVIVALVAAAVAIASQRSAKKASDMNTTAVTRVDMEKEAYIRARDHDVKTIEQQGKRIDELEDDLKIAHKEIRSLKHQLARMAAGLPPEEERDDGST